MKTAVQRFTKLKGLKQAPIIDATNQEKALFLNILALLSKLYMAQQCDLVVMIIFKSFHLGVFRVLFRQSQPFFRDDC